MARKPRPSRQVAADVESALGGHLGDTDLRARLEALAAEPGFAGLTALWGPALYRRNRVVFRPFVLSRFSSRDPTRGFSVVAWTGTAGAALGAWLKQTDADGDVELFRRLYDWKLAAAGRRGTAAAWQGDLLDRWKQARSRAERQRVLSQFDLPLTLDEDAALALYAADADAARAFLLRHLPRGFFWDQDKREPWRRLWASAGEKGDQEFALALYRKQVPVAEWRKDVARLCAEVTDARRLCDELAKRHPEGWVKGIGPVFVEVLTRRGPEVFPYVLPRLASVSRALLFGRDGVVPMVELAERMGWVDLWAAVLRTCGKPDEFDTAVSRLVADRERGDGEVARRLAALAGVSREWNFGGLGLAAVHPLKERTALALFRRFPALVRGPFKLHVGRRWGHTYRDLVLEALDAGELDLVDYLASREATIVPSHFPEDARGRETRESLHAHYEALSGDGFARRAAAVLGQIPAFSIPDYGRLVRENRLARLLFERSHEGFLEAPAVLRDLLEAPEIHVQALAFRVLALPQERARAAAAASLDLLVPTLLRPLHRTTRLLAFAALENGVLDADAGRRVLPRLRETFALPDRRYPKEALVGLLGRLLHRFPELRGEREQPVVHVHGTAP